MSGMTLLDMILQAQGGAAAQQAGEQLGLNRQQTQSAMTALLPAISGALKQNTQTPEGLAALLQALKSGHHEQYIEQPDTMRQTQTIQDGNAILGHLFGSKSVSRAVADRASQQTGLSADILKKMLPLVAALAMGSLSKQTREPSMQSQLAKLAIQNILGGSKGGGILGGLLGGARRGQQQVQQQHQQGLGLLGKMLDADGDGNIMDDVLNMAINAQRR